MAYEFLVGTSRKSSSSYRWVASLEFDELPAVSRLMKRIESTFLQRVSNLFDDQVFSVDEVRDALAELLPLMENELHTEERILLHKILAVLGYANWKQQCLFGAAD
jgi:hypothetical protein